MLAMLLTQLLAHNFEEKCLNNNVGMAFSIGAIDSKNRVDALLVYKDNKVQLFKYNKNTDWKLDSKHELHNYRDALFNIFYETKGDVTCFDSTPFGYSKAPYAIVGLDVLKKKGIIVEMVN